MQIAEFFFNAVNIFGEIFTLSPQCKLNQHFFTYHIPLPTRIHSLQYCTTKPLFIPAQPYAGLDSSFQPAPRAVG